MLSAYVIVCCGEVFVNFDVRTTVVLSYYYSCRLGLEDASATTAFDVLFTRGREIANFLHSTDASWERTINIVVGKIR